MPEITDANQKAFLDAFRERGIITHACAVSGVPRRTVFEWRQAQVDFADAFKEALDEAADKLEEEARRRAVDGVERPLVGRVAKDQDGVVTYVRDYSDKLLEILLGGARPEKFGRKRVELTGKDGGPVEVLDLSKLSTEELETMRALVAKAKGEDAS